MSYTFGYSFYILGERLKNFSYSTKAKQCFTELDIYALLS